MKEHDQFSRTILVELDRLAALRFALHLVGSERRQVHARRCATKHCRGEALRLRWSDVDLEAGRARVVQTLEQTRSIVPTGEPKSTTGRRPMSLDAGTIAVLRAHRHRMRQQRLLVGPDFNELGFVFHQPDGSVATPGCSERRVPSLWPASPHDPRPAPHVGDARSRERRPPPGHAGAARPLHDRHHAVHLQPRVADASRRGGAASSPGSSSTRGRS